jgi:hypothetical protein
MTNAEVVRGVPTRIRFTSSVHTRWGQRVPPGSRLACAAPAVRAPRLRAWNGLRNPLRSGVTHDELRNPQSEIRNPKFTGGARRPDAQRMGYVSRPSGFGRATSW